MTKRTAARGDVRASSSDRNYAGVVFTGTIAEALAQARAQPAYPDPYAELAWANGLGIARYELLKFLRVIP